MGSLVQTKIAMWSDIPRSKFSVGLQALSIKMLLRILSIQCLSGFSNSCMESEILNETITSYDI